MSTSTSRAVWTTLAATAAAGAGALAWGTLVERKLFTLRRVSVPVLPAGATPITVLHLSDMHLAPFQHRKQRWVRALARLKPDLIVDTGDNVGHRDAFESLEHTLEPFRGVPGVFVNGSNDYWAPSFRNPLRYFLGPTNNPVVAEKLDIDREHALFSSLGWKDIDNGAITFEVNGTQIEFFGVDDPHRRYDELETVSSALDELRSESSDDTVPGSGSNGRRTTLSIGVAHAPYQRILNSFVTNGAQLIFAGHTHGGQVCVPGYGALVTNCDIPRTQVKGLSTWRRGARVAFLHVSAGLGTSIYAPVRFACLPEATLLTLVPAS
ncbi:metallophosphoesterase [Subtercola boreus]|uniref:Metallophosphatase n=1 Tax=Subtercola boreus TaxID=120213 RepID=A0A3E0WCL8_9MICO|nr:metallophosphoesterase [Subtercola boreus]RFA22561.1 metallophosphatase [Subtercola boreus]RFA22917.1 metallophosphatase [Subtercola boreus]RFA28668.1 metallophosphatase [Subtercola boreus]